MFTDSVNQKHQISSFFQWVGGGLLISSPIYSNRPPIYWFFNPRGIALGFLDNCSCIVLPSPAHGLVPPATLVLPCTSRSRSSVLIYRDIGSAEHRKEKSRSESPDRARGERFYRPASWICDPGFSAKRRNKRTIGADGFGYFCRNKSTPGVQGAEHPA